jgi:hypothetical protein
MTKGAKIGIGIGVVVALAVGSYFLFFRKGKKDDNKNKKGSDDNSDAPMETVYKMPVTSLEKVKDKPDNAFFTVGSPRPKKGRIVKGDTAIISGTNKFDGEYPVDGVWIDKNGKLGAVSINLKGKYKVVYPKGESYDRTFEGFGQMEFKRPISSFCGCGA